jgi:hypothetical protein
MDWLEGETERVPTIRTDIFGKAAAAGQELNEMARNHANCRMSDDLGIARRFAVGFVNLLQERVAAKARVLLEAISRGHVPHAMAEQPAEVTHLLLERRRCSIGIVFGIEQERVAALHAHVFMAAVTLGEFLVLMFAEETRQGVPHARDRSIFREIVCAAPAPPLRAGCRFEPAIVDVVSPHRARELSQ